MKLSAKVAGIEFDGDTIRLAVVKTGGRLPGVLERHSVAASYDDPEERHEALVAAARELRSQVKSNPSAHVLCAASAYSVVRQLTVPFKGRGRVAAAVPFELEPYLAFPIDDLVVDFSVVEEKDGQTEVVAVGMRAENLADELGVLTEAGFDIDGITIDVAALTGLWHSTQKDPAGLRAVAHVRENGTILAIVDGGALVFFRHLGSSTAHVHEDPAAAGREVQNTVRAYLSRRKGQEDALSGVTITGVDLTEEEREQFGRGFRAPVDYEQVITRLRGPGMPASNGVAEDAEGVPGEAAVPAELRYNTWEAVIGAGHCAAGGGFNYEFRRGPLAKADSVRATALRGAFSAVLAVFVIIGYGMFMYIDHRNTLAELDRVDRAMWEVVRNAFPNAVTEGTVDPDNTNWRELYDFMETQISEDPTLAGGPPTEMFNMPPLLDILSEISAAMPGDKVHVTNVRIRPPSGVRGGGTGPSIEIEGEVDDPNTFNEAFAALRTSDLFRIEEEPRRQVQGGRQTFTITARR